MSRRRRLPLSRTFLLAGSLFFLLQASGELKGPSAESEGFPDLMFTPSAAAADSTATPSDTKLPPHAVRRPLGSGWECKRGYRQEGERCVEVQVPAHAFLGYFGHDWECERGYRKEAERCVPVHIPEHAYLDITGHNWECERGYRREDDRCVEVQVPAHAFLGPSGHGWQCHRGYRRQGKGCEPVSVPEHAYLSYFGHDWVCQDGYRRVDTACEPLAAEIPAQQISPENDLAKLATHVYASRGTSHDAQTIRQLQRLLRQAGYDAGPVDGILGPQTLSALQQFLADHELAAENSSRAATPPASDS